MFFLLYHLLVLVFEKRKRRTEEKMEWKLPVAAILLLFLLGNAGTAAEIDHE